MIGVVGDWIYLNVGLVFQIEAVLIRDVVSELLHSCSHRRPSIGVICMFKVQEWPVWGLILSGLAGFFF
jgi:hypothetical protein